MHVFVTGATGWVGSAVVGELIAAGHAITGLARSPDKAAIVAAAGAEPVVGTLDDLDLLCDQSVKADAVIHTAFDHDFSRFAENSERERRALDAIGEAIAGLGPRLIVTSGVFSIAPGRVATEQDVPTSRGGSRKAEAIARRLAEQGVPTSTIRLAPTVHGVGDRGFVPALIGIARQTGVSAYVGDGSNRWPAVHRSDAARLYRLVAESDEFAPVYHAIGEEGISFRAIAEAIGGRLGVSVEAREPDHFGWMKAFAAADMAASSTVTRSALGWMTAGPTLMTDLDQPEYFDLALSRAGGVSA